MVHTLFLSPACRLGPESLQQVAVVALGNCSPELYEALFGELQALIDDYSNDRQRVCMLCSGCHRLASKPAVVHRFASHPSYSRRNCSISKHLCLLLARYTTSADIACS